MSSEVDLDDILPYHLKDFLNPCRLDSNSRSDEIFVYIRENIPPKLVKLD